MLHEAMKWAIFFFFIITFLKCGRENNSKNGESTFIEIEDSISTENYANKSLRYYLAFSSQLKKDESNKIKALVFVPGLSGLGQSFVPQEAKKFAIANSMAIIAPTFKWDQDNWKRKESYQYPSVWSGEAFCKIIQNIRIQNDINIDELYLVGFSAGAQFVLRFALYKPELCQAVAAHASGGTVIPQKFQDTKFLISVGSMDKSRIKKAKKFIGAAKSVDLYAEYKEYQVGHSVPDDFFKDVLLFFKKNL